VSKSIAVKGGFGRGKTDLYPTKIGLQDLVRVSRSELQCFIFKFLQTNSE
jgi:hypothetical protein